MYIRYLENLKFRMSVVNKNEFVIFGNTATKKGLYTTSMD